MLHILEISVVDTDHVLYKYAYYYEYDALKRMSFKKLPGCEPVYMVYDKRDRLVLTQDGNMRAVNVNKWHLLNVHSTLNGEAQASIVYEYDELGRLTRKRYGNIITESYTYNTRGWLVSKESDAFRMELHYESTQTETEPLYSGNVSEWSWKQGNNGSQMYGFSYDGAGRLIETVHLLKNGSEWNPHNNGYTEKGITYDRNGNILTLQRTASGSTTNNQVYSYDGNKLSSLNGSTYEYDYNGNMTKDHANGLEFTYNSLNLLHEVKEDGMVKATYTYLADGTKLAMRTETGTDGFDYSGRFLYSVTNGTPSLAFVNTTDGFLTNEGMVYALTDHLGSVRVLVDGEGEVLERNDYYPFGTKHPNTGYPSTSNPYLFGGMEKQYFSSNPTYDFGARMLDGKLGRWMTMDPKTEKYYSMTPYGYCGNNPVSNIDRFGMDYWSTNDPDQIGAFFDALNGDNLDNHDYSDWNHMTDNEFTSKLSYNDKNNTYYWTESQVINGELVVTGRRLTLKSGYRFGRAMAGVAAFAAGEFADVMKNSNNTYRLTNSKGKFDFKYYSNGWKGNQYVTTKNVSKVGKVLGKVLFVSDVIQTYSAYSRTYEAIQSGNVKRTVEQGLDAVMGTAGFTPYIGPFISLYWSVGGKELHQLYTDKVILEHMKNGINPGLPVYQPFK